MGHVGEAAAFGVRTPFERIQNGSGKFDPLPNPERTGRSVRPNARSNRLPNRTEPSLLGNSRFATLLILFMAAFREDESIQKIALVALSSFVLRQRFNASCVFPWPPMPNKTTIVDNESFDLDPDAPSSNSLFIRPIK